MKILLNDYGGYAFPFELSHQLASMGHQVMHQFCASLDATPNGNFLGSDNSPDSLSVVPIKLSKTLQKSTLWQRRQQDIEYGRLAAAQVQKYAPDIVMSSNTPLDAQARIQKAAHVSGAGFVFWLQDVLSHAITFGTTQEAGTAGSWSRSVLSPT